jgi:hypothetical protein
MYFKKEETLKLILIKSFKNNFIQQSLPNYSYLIFMLSESLVN